MTFLLVTTALTVAMTLVFWLSLVCAVHLSITTHGVWSWTITALAIMNFCLGGAACAFLWWLLLPAWQGLVG